MFKFLKDKLKTAISSFTKKAEEESEAVEEKEEAQPEEQVEEQAEEEVKEEEKKEEAEEVQKEIKEQEKEESVEETKPEEKGFLKKLFSKKEETTEETTEETDEEQASEKKTILSSLSDTITKTKLSEKKFEDLFFDLEVALLENNVALTVVEKIKQDLKQNVVDVKIRRGELSGTILKTLKKSISSLFEVDKINLLDIVKTKKPYVICFVGINGSGKTTTIAKFVKLFQENNLKCVLAAADTFRAAAIDQLQLHADKLGVKLIKHDYGSDAAAVAFDAIKHAEAKNVDVVLIDTAGRMHSNADLMNEMEKIIRVAKPDLKMFVGESITGNDCVEQAKAFDQAIGIDGIVLSKADVDEKGGAAVSVSYVTGKPILYIGTGQEYEDLTPFDSEVVLKNLGLEA